MSYSGVQPPKQSTWDKQPNKHSIYKHSWMALFEVWGTKWLMWMLWTLNVLWFKLVKRKIWTVLKASVVWQFFWKSIWGNLPWEPNDSWYKHYIFFHKTFKVCYCSFFKKLCIPWILLAAVSVFIKRPIYLHKPSLRKAVDIIQTLGKLYPLIHWEMSCLKIKYCVDTKWTNSQCTNTI